MSLNSFGANKESTKNYFNESLVGKLEKLPVELLPEKPNRPSADGEYTIEELREKIPNGKIIACDFYLQGIEDGEDNNYGFVDLDRDIVNIDHHSPVLKMAKQISSTNLALEYVKENGAVGSNAHVLISHTDCDSVLSSSIVRGILLPEDRFGVAAISADHTGEKNEIADLLQALGDKRDLSFSLRNLEKLLAGEQIDEEALKLLEKRYEDREKAREIVENGNFEKIGSVYFTSVQEKIDGGLLPAVLPNASVIVIGSPMKNDPSLWENKVRLGMNCPDGLTLDMLELPNFGGRWNAGSTKRKGGTKFSPREYAELINNKIEGFKKA